MRAVRRQMVRRLARFAAAVRDSSSRCNVLLLIPRELRLTLLAEPEELSFGPLLLVLGVMRGNVGRLCGILSLESVARLKI
jgi:hypothetical protein